MVLVLHLLPGVLGAVRHLLQAWFNRAPPSFHAIFIHPRGDSHCPDGAHPSPIRLEPSPRGIGYAVLVGILSAIGGTALFAAYGTGANTAMVTVVSGLYPLVTVLLAVTLLRERLTTKQWIGLVFAGAACVLFSF